MSLTKKRIQDKIEIVGEFKTIQVRYADQIIEDGKVISQTYYRDSINCLDEEKAIEHNVKGIADLYWTDDLKKAYKDSFAKI
jgi:hypothetical protein